MRTGLPKGFKTSSGEGPSDSDCWSPETMAVVAVVRICTELGGGGADYQRGVSKRCAGRWSLRRGSPC